MMLTNTNNLEVLFQDLCDEDIASISGGQSFTASASISRDGKNVTATAQASTGTTSTDPTPGTGVTFFNSLGDPVLTNISPNQVTVTLFLQPLGK